MIEMTMQATPATRASKEVSPAGIFGATVLAFLGTAAALSAFLVLLNHPDWWRGLLAAGVVSAMAAAASLPPLMYGLRSSLNQRVAVYFMATGLRATVSLGGGVLAVKSGHYPAAPTMLMMVVFYFAILAAETIYVAKSMWDTKE